MRSRRTARPVDAEAPALESMFDRMAPAAMSEVRIEPGRVDRFGPIPAHRPELGPCWLWLGPVSPYGYAQVSFRGVKFQAHRVVYWLAVGPIPPGQEVDHLCRVRRCVNPKHLEA